MIMIDAGGGVTLQVRTVGSGRPILMIPSLGRGVSDYDAVAGLLAKQGYRCILPEPRGIGGSSGPPPETLFDLARDAAAVCEHMGLGAVDLVGHAFGNRVARAMAASDPERVGRVILLAGGGQTVMDGAVRTALMGSLAQGTKPDAERLQYLQTAFFHPGNNPAVWLRG